MVLIAVLVGACHSAFASKLWEGKFTELTTLNGCLAYVRNIELEVERVEWTGSCCPGRPIEGRGVLKIYFKNNLDRGPGAWYELSGSFSNGAGNGQVTLRSARDSRGFTTRMFGGCFGGQPDCDPRLTSAAEVAASEKPASISKNTQAAPVEAQSLQPNTGLSSAVTNLEPSESQPAMNCVKILKPSTGWFQMKNDCTFDISVSWCYVGTSDCKNGTWGYTNTGNIAAGGIREASTFIGRAERTGLAFSACSGRDVHINETGPKTFICK